MDIGRTNFPKGKGRRYIEICEVYRVHSLKELRNDMSQGLFVGTE